VTHCPSASDSTDVCRDDQSTRDQELAFLLSSH